MTDWDVKVQREGMPSHLSVKEVMLCMACKSEIQLVQVKEKKAGKVPITFYCPKCGTNPKTVIRGYAS